MKRMNEVTNPEIFISHHRVRSYECDYYNHVNNATYLNYLEFGRIEAMEKKKLPLRKLKEEGYMSIVKRIEIDYKYPATVGDNLVIRSYISQYRKTSGIFRQEILLEENQRICAEADVLWVYVNLQGQPVRIPSFVQEAFQMA